MPKERLDKKAIDFQVKVAVDEIIRCPLEAGFEFDPEFLRQLREVIEGMAIREFGERRSAEAKADG